MIKPAFKKMIRITTVGILLAAALPASAYQLLMLIEKPSEQNDRYIQKITVNMHCEPTFPSILLNTIPQNKKRSSPADLTRGKTSTLINVGNPCYARYWSVRFAQITVLDNKQHNHACGSVFQGYDNIDKHRNTCNIGLNPKRNGYHCKVSCQ